MKKMLWFFFAFAMFLFAYQSSQAQVQFIAKLNGSQEVPPVNTPASGQITATLSDSQLVVTGTFSGLLSDFNHGVRGGAHLHLAPAGRNGGIVIELVVTLGLDHRSGSFVAAQNTFKLTPAQYVALHERKLYANIHTLLYPGGEIRGQLLPQADAYYRVNLAGSNEVPAINSTGFGALVGELKGDTLTLSGSFNNLTSDFNPAVAGGSHIHLGYAGQNGPIQFGLVPSVASDNRSGIFEAAANKIILTSALKDALEARRLYANVHTTAYPGGELRGQIVPMDSDLFRTNLTGSQEVPPVETSARGALIFELDGDDLTVSGSFSGLAGDFNFNIAGGAHLHLAPAGRNGGILIPLMATVDAGLRSGIFEAAKNKFALVDSQIVALRARKLYANIHTTTSPGGEIRGQVLPENYSYYHAWLSGRNEVQPVTSSGNGGVIAEVSGTRLVVTGSFNNLANDFNPNVAGGSHLHLAPAGQNGSIAIGLVPVVAANKRSGVFEAAGNFFALTAQQAAAFQAGELYANVHTTGFPGGELRGQLLFDPNAFPGQTMITGPPSGASIKIEGSGSTTLSATWNAVTDPNRNLVVYIWQLSGDRQFSNILVNRNVGNATSFTTNFAILDSLLALANVAVGDSARLYHRVYSSDGSLQKASASDSLVLRRGGVPINIAAARVKSNSTTVTVEGIVTRALGRFAYIQDATAAIPTFQTSGPLRTAITNGDVRKGDRLRVSGVLAEFNNLKELTATSAQPFVFQVLSRNNPLPAPQVVTLTEVARNGEQYESELIRVNSLFLLPTTDATFRAATSYMVRDEGDTATFRIGNSGDSRVIGRPVPPGLFDFEGVLGDFRGDYQLTPVDTTDILLRTGVASESTPLPRQFALLANYPNPFNPATTIRYDLPRNVHVKLAIYDLLGKKVRTLVDAEEAAGFKHITWDGASDAGVRVVSGVYLYRVEAGDFSMTRKMILMR
ncbi:MAG: CHRD domain-containing protein [candidate division KSB1 bacterium]|nr:CHRD domain-containing protein [candidate division KSB1 bacterium]